MSKLLTIEDIRNSKRASGFDHVGDCAGQAKNRRSDRWRAQAGVGNTHGSRDAALPSRWKGPVRSRPEVAAQDYCDHINGNPQVARKSAALKTANHPKAVKLPVTPAVQVALDILRDARAKVSDQGTVYLVAEGPLKLLPAVKIGWTSKTPPAARLGDYQAGNPRKLHMLATRPGTKTDEAALHAKYIDDNVLGEWFRPTSALLSEFGIKTTKGAKKA